MNNLLEYTRPLHNMFVHSDDAIIARRGIGLIEEKEVQAARRGQPVTFVLIPPTGGQRIRMKVEQDRLSFQNIGEKFKATVYAKAADLNNSHAKKVLKQVSR